MFNRHGRYRKTFNILEHENAYMIEKTHAACSMASWLGFQYIYVAHDRMEAEKKTTKNNVQKW